MGKIILHYWKNIFCEAWTTMYEDIGILGFFIELILSYFYSLFTGQKLDLWGFLMGAKAFLFLIALAWLFYIFKVSAMQDKKKTDKITLKEYEEIQLANYPYPIANNNKNTSVWDYPVVDTLAFQIENQGGASLIDCKIRFLDAKYRYDKNKPRVKLNNSKGWVSMCDIEKKLLKWDDELLGKNGLISINAGSDEIIKLAELSSRKLTSEHLFHFVFSNKTSDIPRSDGEFSVNLRLEGKVERDGLLVDITPILFNVEFNCEENKNTFNFKRVKKYKKKKK